MKLYKVRLYKNFQSKYESKGRVNRANIPIMSTGQSAFYSIVGLLALKGTIYGLQRQEFWKCVHVSVEHYNTYRLVSDRVSVHDLLSPFCNFTGPDKQVPAHMNKATPASIWIWVQCWVLFNLQPAYTIYLVSTNYYKIWFSISCVIDLCL